MKISDKQAHILNIAEDLFADKGFEATTVRAIADCAGVNVAMISYYFGSKEKLMETLFRQRMAAVQNRLEDLIGSKEYTPFQKMEVIIEEYIKRVVEKQSFYKIMLCEQVINKNEQIITLLKELKSGHAKLFNKLINEGQLLGIYKKEVDVVMLLNTMTGIVIQAIINKEFDKEYNKDKKVTGPEFESCLRDRLVTHLKLLFKATLGYEL